MIAKTVCAYVGLTMRNTKQTTSETSNDDKLYVEPTQTDDDKHQLATAECSCNAGGRGALLIKTDERTTFGSEIGGDSRVVVT